MKNYVYSLYNKLSARYDSVMSFPSDAMALHRLSNGGIDKKEYDVCRVGYQDIESGVITSEPPVRLVWEENTTELPKSES